MKKAISILLILTILLTLCSCGASNSATEHGTETVIDGAGREIYIPLHPEEATIASVYAVSVPFFVALGITDRVLAVNAKSDFWYTADANLKAAGTVGRGVVDLEKLAGYAPTALVHRSNDPDTVESVERLGIDAVTITVENVEDIKTTLRMLGKYFGAEDRAETAVAWIESEFAYVASIVETIPESQRKTALLMGGNLGRVAGDDMLQTWMIRQAGGIPVVDEGKDHSWIDSGVEKVFQWNPEVIFCTSSTSRDYTPEEMMADSTWSAVTAVKNKDIHIIPTQADSWDMPGMSCVLGTLYMLRTMYPDYFSAEDFEDHVDSYYRFMFGRCFDEELCIDWDAM